MNSTIAQHLKPRFEPVALVHSDTIPEGTQQYKPGKWGCILNLFATASRRRRITGGERETITCPGARTALGLGFDLVEDEQSIDHYAAAFSKGLKSARDGEAYRANMSTVRSSWRPLLEQGERRFCNYQRARQWLEVELPRYQTGSRYVLFVPLSVVNADHDVQAVVFLVNPVELAGLLMLLGSVAPKLGTIEAPQGPECFRISGYVCCQKQIQEPRAVLGMLDVDGREAMRRHFDDDTLSLAIPMQLFERMEREAEDCIFQTPRWENLRAPQ